MGTTRVPCCHGIMEDRDPPHEGRVRPSSSMFRSTAGDQ
ncbi:hypothetical protein B005_2901 [Nocardiopsis alba ATCC BAA-2165]|uniref:Uncharacterized protein n=1 Tax=Nocardiopsis alba (strain ATCC BAA-2165 / BE74) TaxID=1205910 RepID=J7LA17_NOCAA|nr:hypothetical protein B005_2901 [Nocardiopsis alba ATCC BAA-2165]